MQRKHTYSQHFLRNPRFVDELVKLAKISAGDTVYDIGAGSGIITSSLAAVCKKVYAVEFEPETAVLLRSNVKSFQNVEVIEANILSIKLPIEPYKVFANIPFHISSEIVRKLVESPAPPTAMHLIVQKQFANKLLQDHRGFSSQLGMQLGPEFTMSIRKSLKRTDFWPHPNVDTVLLEIIHRSKPLIPITRINSYRSMINECFSDPKKFANLPRDKAGLPTAIKPSDLTLSQWLVLFSLQDLY